VYNPHWNTFEDLLHMGIDIAWAMIVGGAVLGTALGIPAYYITKIAFKRMQSRNNKNGSRPLEQSAALKTRDTEHS